MGGPGPRWESSLALGRAKPVARHCNFAQFRPGTTLGRDLWLGPCSAQIRRPGGSAIATMRTAWHGDAFRDVVDWVSDTWGVAVCNFCRSAEFRFGNAVEAVQGSRSIWMYSQITSAVTAACVEPVRVR